MFETARPLLPTTARQHALVYALNVLLLLNLTVIVVLLSVPTNAPDAREQVRQSVDLAPFDPARLRPKPKPKPTPTPTAFSQPFPAESADSAKPEPLAHAAAKPTKVTVEPEPGPGPEPTTPSSQAGQGIVPAQPEDSPIRFFGVGLD